MTIEEVCEIKPRTVAELIEVLKLFPQDATIVGTTVHGLCEEATDCSQIFGYPQEKTGVVDQVAIHFWPSDYYHSPGGGL